MSSKKRVEDKFNHDILIGLKEINSDKITEYKFEKMEGEVNEKHLVPFSRFKRELNSWFKRVSSGNTTVIITRNGEPINVMAPLHYKKELKYKVKDLISQCDMDAKLYEDEREDIEPVGREKL